MKARNAVRQLLRDAKDHGAPRNRAERRRKAYLEWRGRKALADADTQTLGEVT